MDHRCSRRNFLGAAAGAALSGPLLFALQPRTLTAAETVASPAGAVPPAGSVVSLIQGESRRNNVCESLAAIEDRILPVLKTKKHVVIKPNIVSTGQQLASTHVDTLHGVLDFLGPRFQGDVIIAESSAGFTSEGYENFGYQQVVGEHKPLDVRLVDLNEEGDYQVRTILDGNLHAVPVRLAARLLDPDAFVICAAILKTHNTVIATLSIKNMALGAPLHSARSESSRWNDKRLFHGGVRQTHVDIMLAAQQLQPFWGATVIDGFEGMEGNGPTGGTAVPSRIAISSTDYVAADRVAVEAMGIDASWIGYLQFCAQAGLGQNDLSQIDVRGAKLADVVRKYKMHDDIERELRWMGEMKEVPEKLG